MKIRALIMSAVALVLMLNVSAEAYPRSAVMIEDYTSTT